MLDPSIKFFSLHGNGDTIRISREIYCLPYAGFLIYIFFKCYHQRFRNFAVQIKESRYICLPFLIKEKTCRESVTEEDTHFL